MIVESEFTINFISSMLDVTRIIVLVSQIIGLGIWVHNAVGFLRA